MRDLPGTADLLGLARRLLLDELAPLLPPEHERHAHLIATAMTIAARELRSESPLDLQMLRAFFCPHPSPLPEGEGEHGQIPSPPGRGRDPRRQAREGEGQSGEADSLLSRLAADLRNGAFETTPSREAAARAILWRMVIAKLRETNPQFLAANGIGPAESES